MVQHIVENTVKSHSDIFRVVDENNIKVCSMTITLTPCINGSVMVTDDRFATDIVGMEFHNNYNTLVFDVIRRAKMMINIEDINSFEVCCSDRSGVSVKCTNKELIVN